MSGTRIIFDCPLPPWFVGMLVAAALVVVAGFLRRDTAGLRKAARYGILALFLIGVGLIGCILLNPRIVRTWPDPRKPRLALLIDGSRSMLFPDDYRDKDAEWIRTHLSQSSTTDVPRVEVVRAILDTTRQKWLAPLLERFELDGRRFAEDVETVPVGQDAPPFEVIEDGSVTALGQALRHVAQESGDRRPRCVVLISDGAWNTGSDPVEASRLLGRLDVPVYPVGVGDPEPPRDVAVTALRGPERALVGDVLFLTAEVSSTGMGAVGVQVELVDNGQTVDEKRAVTLPSGRPVSVAFSHVPMTPGRHDFSARVAPVEEDRDEGNNMASMAVEVISQKIRVLLVDAEPRWEFRFIRSVLDRDPAVEPTVCLFRPRVGPIKGTGYLDALPTDKRGLTAFDLIILGDVARSLMPDAFLKELADMVQQRGGALIVVAGRRRRFRELIGTPLAPLLPVRLESGSAGGAGAPFRIELTQDGVTHLVTRLASDPRENEAIWDRLPPIRWAAGVGELMPGATALLVHPHRLAGAGKLPVVAVQRVGRGKVMFSGTEGTWRWRKTVGDKYHYRFWAQTVRWMIKKQFVAGDQRARLSVDRTECKVGERVEVEVHCVDRDGFPLLNAEVRVRITSGSDKALRLVLQPAPGGWGIYRGTFVPARPGDYALNPAVALYGKEPLPSSVSLRVTQPDLERNFLAQDRSSLQAIAEASGGRYLKVNEVGLLPSLLAARAERRLLTAEHSPCRHWAYYLAIAAVLSAAWVWKKWSGLA